MKRVLAMIVGAGIAVGGGAAAWAGTAGAGGPNREAVRACLDQAREELPDAGRAARRDAVKTCLGEAGIEVPTPTPAQKAKRDAVRSCIETAKEDNAHDRAAARTSARDCLADAGVAPGRLRARFAEARQCLTDVRGANPDATRAELRVLVKDCVAAQ